MTPSSVDRILTDPGFMADPYPAYAWLREHAPITWSDAWGAWVVSRYDEVVALVRDHARLSSAGRFVRMLETLPADQLSAATLLVAHFAESGLIHSDPPGHHRLRALISKAFSASVIEGLRPRVEEIVDQLLDAAVDDGTMDILDDLAYPLPAIVIAEMLGAPPEDRDLFKRWSDDIVAFQGTGRALPQAIERSNEGLAAMRAYLGDLFEERRRRHHDDLLGLLVDAEEAGDRLTTEELYSTCVTFLIAGHETTTSLLSSAVLTLLRHPEQLAALRGERSLIASAVEECLRYESPVQRLTRLVVEEVELDGVQMRPGEIVILLLGAANRDERVFPDPERFDIRRQPNRHLGFGTGIHFCLGAPLARLETSIALGALLDRYPGLELAGPTGWQTEKGLFRCVTGLPVRFGNGAEVVAGRGA